MDHPSAASVDSGGSQPRACKSHCERGGALQGQSICVGRSERALQRRGTMRSTVWYNSPGIGFAGQGTRTIEQALRWAHAADPAARLFVNEIGAEVLNRKS